MRFNKRNFVLASTLAIGGATAANAQTTANGLPSLVATSAQRIVLAEQVAFSKWDSGKAVEDAPREAQVIAGAAKAAETSGLDQESVSAFFKAQIEANKLVQYSLLADWNRQGKAPKHTAVDLGKTIRPALDEVQTKLIAELAATTAIRTGTSCHAEVARAVGRYASSHAKDFSALEAIALDRAMATACVR
jgi:chorismate mutase